MYRLLTVGSILLWAGAMSALFYRDVLPAWTAQSPPPMTQEEFEHLHREPSQYSIMKDGRQVGTAWSELSTAGTMTTLRGTVFIDSLLMNRPLLVESTTEFDEEGKLDNFSMQVYGVPMTTIEVEGERRGIYFPCTLQVGPIHRQANLDLSASRMIGDSLRPFSYLPMLEVGQSWRMQIINPLSLVQADTSFSSIVATVTGTEKIVHLGERKECYVVETSPMSTRAWVLPDGRVIRQEVQMPGFGKVLVREEPFDANDRSKARSRVPRQHHLGRRSSVSGGD
jgi:hypothetical protein